MVGFILHCFFAEAVGKHEKCDFIARRSRPEPSRTQATRIPNCRFPTCQVQSNSIHHAFTISRRADELDLVRGLEMTDRNVGTKVHTQVMANDPAALLPLQEALGYDLAQSLFSQQRNLVLEGLTDYWYVESLSEILRAAKLADLNQKIALVPAKTAGKVVYYATILHAHKLKVAALLDSDAAGDQAAQQEVLVHKLGNKRILRTRDSYCGAVETPEIKDLLRDTLVTVAKHDLGWDVEPLLTLSQNGQTLTSSPMRSGVSLNTNSLKLSFVGPVKTRQPISRKTNVNNGPNS